MRKTIFLFSIVLLLVITGCRDNELTPSNGDDVNQGLDLTELTNYQANEVLFDQLLVTVSDESGVAIDGAAVTIGGVSSSTSALGLASFTDVTAYENFIQVTVEMAGYHTNYKTVVPTNTSTTQVIDVVLLEEELTASFDAVESTTISLNDSEVSVGFTGGIVDENGDEYTGNVHVYLNHLPADEDATFEVMPGALLALNSESEMQVLETYGMIGVELRDDAGNELNVTTENPATLTFPIATEQQSYAPEAIPLWYFDEELGIWIEDGEATKNAEGTAYVGEVTHFSWWNCDVPFDLVNVCIELVDQNGNALPNTAFKLLRHVSGRLFTIRTNSDGMACGPMPVGEEFTVEVIDHDLSCLTSGGLHTETIGPFTSDENIQITVDTDALPIVNYVVHGEFSGCDGGNHIIVLEYQDTQVFQDVEDDDSFEFVVLGCEEDEFIVYGYDPVVNEMTDVISVEFDADTDSAEVMLAVESCATFDPTYVGDLEFTTQEQLDNFFIFPYTKIDGNVSISGLEVTSLSVMASIQEVTGDLIIGAISTSDYPTRLTSLAGLEALTTVGGNFIIYYNTSLLEISSLSNLVNVGSLYVSFNFGLTSLVGLEGVTEVDFLWLNLSPALSLDPVVNITKLNEGGQLSGGLVPTTGALGLSEVTGSLTIRDMDALTDLSLLSNLTTVDDIIVVDNENLTSLSGLDNITTLTGEFTVGGPGYYSNPNLVDFCAVQHVDFQGSYTVEGNAYNPSQDDLANGNCKQD